MTLSFLSYLFGCLTVHGAAWFVMVSEHMTDPIEEEGFFTLSMLCLAVTLLLCFPFGMLCDLLRTNGRAFAAFGCLVTAVAALLAKSQPEFAVILLGVGVSAFTVGGLCDAVTQGGGLTRIGIFLSMIFPGVALGKKCGGFRKFPAFYFVVLLLFFAVMLLNFCRNPREKYTLPASKKLFSLSCPLLPHKWPGLLCSGLCAVLILFVGLNVRNPGSDFRFAWLVPAAAVFAGLFVGGVLADVFGAVLVGPAGLCLSAVLCVIGKERFLFYAAALFCLGIALPAAVGEFMKAFSGKEGRGIAVLSLCAEAAYCLSLLLQKKGTALPAAVLPALCACGAVLLVLTAGRHLYLTKEAG